MVLRRCLRAAGVLSGYTAESVLRAVIRSCDSVLISRIYTGGSRYSKVVETAGVPEIKQGQWVAEEWVAVQLACLPVASRG